MKKALYVALVATILLTAVNTVSLVHGAIPSPPDLNGVEYNLSESINYAQLAQQELKEWRESQVDQPPPVDVSNLRNFDSYNEMKSWVEGAIKKLPPLLSENEKFRQLQVLALNDGFLFSLAPSNRREFYDSSIGLYVTRLEGGAIAGDKYYLIRFILDHPAYLTVGAVGGE